MSNPTIRPWRRSSRSWPPVELELHGSPRLAVLWALWALALAAALWTGCALPWWSRLGLAGLALGAGWRGVLSLLGRRGLAAHRTTNGRLRWERDGRWWHQSGALEGTYVQPDPPQRLGSLLWLRWREQGRRRYLLFDARTAEPRALARLKARMKFTVSEGHSRQP
jgi:hypothetical protein